MLAAAHAALPPPQSIACKEEWRLLQPINRTEQLYHDLLQAHSNKESLFHHWRRRYAVAGNDFAERPKRRQSVPCQALRAAAGLLVEWLRLSLRHGWLGSHRTINTADIELREGGRGDWAKVWESRRDLDLDLPYGPKALDLGYVTDEHSPGERRRLALKHQKKQPPEPEPWESPPDGDADALPF